MLPQLLSRFEEEFLESFIGDGDFDCSCHNCRGRMYSMWSDRSHFGNVYNRFRYAPKAVDHILSGGTGHHEESLARAE